MKKNYKIKITRDDISKITFYVGEPRMLLPVDYIRSASVDEIYTTRVLLVLQEFLRERHCEPDFEVDLGD